MVTSPGGTSRGGAPRARVGPAADGALRGGLGGLPADRRARRPARGERRPRRGPGPTPARDVGGIGVATRRRRSTDLRRAPLADLRDVDLRAPGPRLLGRRGRALGPAGRVVGRARRRGLAPARARPRRTPAGRTGRSPSTSATSRTGRSSRSTTSARALETGRGRPTTTTTAATSTRSTSAAARRGRRCRATAIARAARARRDRACSSAARRLPLETIRSDERVGLGLQGPPRPLSRPPRGHRAVGRGAARPPGRRRPVRRRPAPARPRRRSSAADRAIAAPTSTRLLRRVPPAAWTSSRAHARLDAARPRRPPRRLVRGGRPRRSTCTGDTGSWLADPEEGIDAWNERHVAAPASATDAERPRPLRRGRTGRLLRGGRLADASRSCARPTAGQLGLRLPPRPRPQAPRDARPVVRHRRLARSRADA